MKYYEKDYEVTSAALESALRRHAQLADEINALHSRRETLRHLIKADYPYKGRNVIYHDQSAASAIVNNIEAAVTERVRGVLMAAKFALTSGEINEHLKQLGEVLNPKANPWALIHGICRRLVDQGFAREVEKDGHKAWIIAPKTR
jgi:hypothetical protein